MNKEKHYYFPTMTKDIMFTRGVKYVWLSKHYKKQNYGKIYTLYDFINGDSRQGITFIGEDGKYFNITCFDCGSFLSLVIHRKNKLKKIESVNAKKARSSD